MKDSYLKFIENFINENELIKFGLKETIYIPNEKANLLKEIFETFGAKIEVREI
jgi:hypothetical protein